MTSEGLALLAALLAETHSLAGVYGMTQDMLLRLRLRSCWVNACCCAAQGGYQVCFGGLV